MLYGQGGGFTGLYEIDGKEEETAFTSSETTTDVHKYSVTVAVEESITIDVFPSPTEDSADAADETDVTALTCRILDEDDTVLYEETYSVSSTKMKTFSFSLDDS